MSSWNRFEKEVDKGPYQATWAIGKWVGFIILVAIFLIVVFKPFAYIGKITQVDNAIYNYEYFYNQSQAYNAINKKIVTAEKSVQKFVEQAGARKDWSFEDKNEYSRLNTILDGLRYQCNDIVADYNAKSVMVSRSIFKTSSTPYKLTECK